MHDQATQDREYFEEQDRKAQAIAEQYNIQSKHTAQVVEIAGAYQGINAKATEWNAPGLAVNDEVIGDVSKLASHMQQSAERTDLIRAGDTVSASFPAPNDPLASAYGDSPAELKAMEGTPSVVHAETHVAKSIITTDSQWQQVNSGQLEQFKGEMAGINQSDTDRNSVAFNPPHGSTASAVLVVPESNGNIREFGVNPVAQERVQAQVVEQKPTAEKQAQPANVSPDQGPAQGQPLPPSPSRGTSNRFGGDNAISDRWEKHEQAQKDLQRTITAMEDQVKGKDNPSAEDVLNLEAAKNQYALNEHKHLKTSFMQTAAFAKSTNIGGARDEYTLGMAERQVSFHNRSINELQGKQDAIQKQISDIKNGVQQPTQQQGQPAAQKVEPSQEQKLQQGQQPKQPAPGQQPAQSADKEYDPWDRVNKLREQGREKLSQEPDAKGAMSDKEVSETKVKAAQYSQEQAQGKEKEKDEGKQLAR